MSQIHGSGQLQSQIAVVRYIDRAIYQDEYTTVMKKTHAYPRSAIGTGLVGWKSLKSANKCVEMCLCGTTIFLEK